MKDIHDWHRLLLGLSLISLICSGSKPMVMAGSGLMFLAILPIMILELVESFKLTKEETDEG